MAANIIKWNQINVDAITFGSPKSLDNGGKIIGLYHEGKTLVFQTPPMNSPYGMSKWSSDTGLDKWSLDLSITHPEFLECLKSVEERILNEGLVSSQNWFKKKINSKEVLEALYTRIVKYSKNPETGEITDKYPPVLNLKLPQKNGQFECEVYDKEKNRIPVSDSVPKRSSVTAIVQCTGLWVAAGKFGCTFKVVQMLVNAPNVIKGYAFQDDLDDEVSSPEDI